MEQAKRICSRCHSTKEICHFQTMDGDLRKSCAQCRNYFSARKRQSNPQPDSDFGELEMSELKQRIKNLIITENQGNEFFENDSHGIRFKCTLKMEEFEDIEEIEKCIAKYVEKCDGYSYK
jgi:hypothetical protein